MSPHAGVMRIHKVAQRAGRVIERGSQPVLTVGGIAVGLAEACRRLGFSVRTGKRRIAEGTFPVPELPRIGRSVHRFSSVEIDWYLSAGSTASLERQRGFSRG